MYLEKFYSFYIIKNISWFIIFQSYKIFNSKNKSKRSRSNKFSYFKYFSKFRHFSFKNTQPNDFNFLILNKKTKNIFLKF